ncbi:MAG: LPP20 family lipoprotein, partial [Myxococcota bacterium]
MSRRASLGLALVAGLALIVHAAGARAATPDWVAQNGAASAYPSGRFLVGFAQTTGKNAEAVEAAKQQAAADLARQVSVQIEANVVDVLQQKEGRVENELTSRIRATSDIRLDGVRFETHRRRKQVYALAVLERGPAAIA